MFLFLEHHGQRNPGFSCMSYDDLCVCVLSSFSLCPQRSTATGMTPSAGCNTSSVWSLNVVPFLRVPVNETCLMVLSSLSN